jgi:branched-chain amino acid transport system permease protein
MPAMAEFWALTVAGIATYGCVYALTALGLVVTYATSATLNLAQGALGMMGAYLYWQLSVDFGLPPWAAFILVVLIIAPVVGALMARYLVQPVRAYGQAAQLSVSIGVLLMLFAIATSAWSPSTGRTVPQFFNGRTLTVAGVVLTWDEVVILALTAAAALGLRLVLFHTRAGTASRAVADNLELVALTGAWPLRYAQAGWAAGAAFAAAAGILIVPLVTLNITTLTLVVINGYGAAVAGRLKNLPVTLLAGLGLGLVQSYAVGYLPVGQAWSTLEQILPMIILFGLLIMVGLPLSRGGSQRLAPISPAAPWPRVATTVGLFAIAALATDVLLPASGWTTINSGVALGIIMLSLLLLSGYGGQVSLCQLSLAGLGAFAMSKVGGTGGSLLGLLAAVGLAGAAGACIAALVHRRRGITMALATLAVAVGLDQAFFSNARIFGTNLSIAVARPHLPGLSLDGNRTYFVSLCIIFGALALGLEAVRKSRFGRRLLAMSDNPVAGATIGISGFWTNVLLFGAAGALAGLGGALYGGAQVAVGPDNFNFLLNLTVFLIAVVWGIRTTGAMLLAGVSLALGPFVQSHLSQPPDVLSLTVGLTAISVARAPDGPVAAVRLRWQSRRAPA